MNRLFDVLGFVLTPLNILVGVLDLPEDLVKAVYLSSILLNASLLRIKSNRRIRWIPLEIVFIMLLVITSVLSESYQPIIKTVGLIALIYSLKHYSLKELIDYLNSRKNLLVVTYVVVGIILFSQYGFSENTAKNSVSIVLIGLLSLTGTYKDNYLLTVIVILTLLLLGSRSSIAIVLVLFLFVNLRRFSFKRVLLFIIVGLVLSTVISSLIELGFSVKDNGGSFIEGIFEAVEERDHLISQGLEVLWERPLIGVGLGHDYYTDVIIGIRGGSYHVHNGYLHTLIEIGILNFAILIFILFYRNKRFLQNEMFFLTLIYVLMRAYGESYFFLNYGNIFSVLLMAILFTDDNKKGAISK